ncbi:MAG TPA: SDR family oxidoreductase [Solirubrobacteraceae bacterium]|nr:SDR family oxidoreductase [Solirubrobacteraceae bacterium]
MILVAGGTGRLGTLLVNRLVNRNLAVRVLTRQRARAEHLASELVTVVSGDVRDPETLAPATAGVDVVVSAVHGFTDPQRNSLAAVDRDGNANLIEAAKSAGADLVLMSTVDATADSPLELFRMKHAAERHAAASGVPTTIVRATAFLELWIDLINQTAGRSGRPLVFGRGENPINFVAVADVAAAVEQAVTDPTTRGRTLEIGGPDNLTFDQLAQAVQTAAGRPGTPRHIPPLMLWLMANSIGRVKPELGRQARAALAMDRTDLTFDPTRLTQLYPDLPHTALAEVLARNGTERAA